MATAYAALVSLMNTLTLELTPRPHHPIPFDNGLLTALQERVGFLVEFLEEGWKGAEHLEPRITHLAYAAEDAIEIPIVDQFCSGSVLTTVGNMFSQVNSLDLVGIIEDLDSIKADVMLIKDKSGIKHLHRTVSRFSSSSSAPHGEKTKMVGFEEEKRQIMDELTRGESRRRLIPIVGMGGIGKTTLARNVYDDDSIATHFDVCAWATVSQDYNVKDILMGVLSTLHNQRNTKLNVEILGEQVHKSLFDRRYLVILDDMWSIDVWDEIKWCFPDNANGSRIIVTTRLSNLAKELSRFSLGMKCLDENNSWDLFCEKVFPQNCCPVELEQVGKRIAQSCRGLPLTLVVIGGLLANSEKTLEYWEHVAEYFSSYLYLHDDEHCSKILSLSYNHLPVYLKPCLLYLGVFQEDHEILVSRLIKLWIAEGFLKPLGGKILEEIAEEYLKDLIERNLITVSRWGSSGKMKYCVVHDLLRELCLREAEKEKFLCFVTEKCLGVPLSMSYQRRIVIRVNKSEMELCYHVVDSLISTSHVRSLILPDVHELSLLLGSAHLKLLRILIVIYDSLPTYVEVVPNLVNIRYLDSNVNVGPGTHLASKTHLFRNFQMLDGRGGSSLSGSSIDIWNLVQLRHVTFNSFFLPMAPYCTEDQHDYNVLENLQSLSCLLDFRFVEAAIKRIPNVKKLKVHYKDEACEWSHYNTNNLDQLQKLESLNYLFSYAPNRSEFLQNLAFPHSLKKLSLYGCKLLWEDMTVFGSLPNLVVLKLRCRSFVGPKWNPVEGEFTRLKFLYMEWIDDLINWNADSSHFPRLEQLVLHNCRNLKEIPLDIGEITTLRLIQLKNCRVSAMMSAKNILEEQQSFGNDGLVVEIRTLMKLRSIHDLEIKNFISESYSVTYMDSEESD